MSAEFLPLKWVGFTLFLHPNYKLPRDWSELYRYDQQCWPFCLFGTSVKSVNQESKISTKTDTGVNTRKAGKMVGNYRSPSSLQH